MTIIIAVLMMHHSFEATCRTISRNSRLKLCRFRVIAQFLNVSVSMRTTWCCNFHISKLWRNKLHKLL